VPRKPKKRKPPLAKDLKLYNFIAEKYAKKKEFADCGEFFKWVAKQIKIYNKSNNTRFNDTFILKYVSWKAGEDRK